LNTSKSTEEVKKEEKTKKEKVNLNWTLPEKEFSQVLEGIKNYVNYSRQVINIIIIFSIKCIYYYYKLQLQYKFNLY
jgi:hypothetical protein